MKLTAQQLRFFQTFGYLVFPKLFSLEEISRITADFEYSIQNFGGGRNHDGSTRTMFGRPIEHTPFMCSLLDDPRILGLIGGVIGDDFTYCSGDGNYYSGDTGWHPDGNHNLLTPVKVAFYLDPVTADTGALRVIPGSFDQTHPIHRFGANPQQSENLFGVSSRDYPGHVALNSNPGDVVMFNHDTWHAAFGGGHRRRMFTLNCHRRAHTPEEHQALKDWVFLHFLQNGRGLSTALPQAFTDTMMSTASPARRQHLEQCAATYAELLREHSAPSNGLAAKKLRSPQARSVTPQASAAKSRSRPSS